MDAKVDTSLETSRRHFVSSVGASVASISAGNQISPQANLQSDILFYEDFESGETSKFTSVGTGPNTLPAVVEDPAVAEGQYMLRTGRGGTSTADPIEIPDSGAFQISFSVALISSRYYAESAIATINYNSQEKNLLSLFGDPDGNFSSGINDIDLGSFELDEWTNFRAVFEKNQESVECVYYLNGSQRGTAEIESDIFGTNLELEVYSGEAALWDEFRIEYQEESANAGDSNFGSDGVGILSGFVALVLMAFAIIFTAISSSIGSGSESKTGSQRQVTEEDVQDGLEKAEESLQRDRRR
ncbi:hypothetical protein [Haloarcula halophila]|uniref:hypothetical protein n=1 Tax=Haloarcula TaxID=2237 RepID=UPI0023E3F93D|nr:hypothetical protein [Halomicroarcula sp. DFY41]